MKALNKLSSSNSHQDQVNPYNFCSQQKHELRALKLIDGTKRCKQLHYFNINLIMMHSYFAS